MKFLPGLPLRPGYYEPIEREINRIFAELFYYPLLGVVNCPHPEYHNANVDALESAIADGFVWYEDGKFSGQFNARISRELLAIGAKFNIRSQTWSLPLPLLPAQISMAKARADLRYDAVRRGLLTTLADVNIDSIDTYQQTPQAYDTAITWMNNDFIKSVKAITIPPQLTPTQKQIIADQWGKNLNLYIKKWSEQNILNLRETIQAGALAGARPESFEKMISANYGVSRNKARFLARQETSLLMSSFHESRYGEIGIEEYKWSDSHDKRVRHDHHLLNGKIFRFDQPPVENLKKGTRGNPGQPFGCRCIAIPVTRNATGTRQTLYITS